MNVYTCGSVYVCVLSSTSHFRVQFQEKILRNTDEIFIIHAVFEKGRRLVKATMGQRGEVLRRSEFSL